MLEKWRERPLGEHEVPWQRNQFHIQRLTIFAFPVAHRKRIRTTNGVERLHREVHRRARVVSNFPN